MKVGQIDPVVELKEWLDDDLLRQQIPGSKNREQEDIEPPRKPTAHERHHTGKKEGEKERWHQDQRRVPVFAGDITAGPGIAIVVERQRFRSREKSIGDRFRKRSKRRIDRADQWHQPDNCGQCDEAIEEDPAPG